MSNIIDSIQLSGTTYQIQGSGGGKAIEAGRGISITTGETADTVSFNLPISAGTGTDSIIEGNLTIATGDQSHAEGFATSATSVQSHAEGYGTKANGGQSHAEGYDTTASGTRSHAEGYLTTASASQSHAEGLGTKASGRYSHAEGNFTNAANQSEHASGQYNNSVSASTTFGDSGNTLFSVGNGTADNARHNAFEIRQNGDIYLTKDGQDVKLQDQLGGGGGNPTIELTQAQYDALVTAGTVQADTYYIITDAQAGDLTNYYTKTETNTLLNGKQATLVSGTNIKTINNESILGSGNIDIQGGGVDVVQTTGTSTTDVMSQDAVTTQLNGKGDAIGLDMAGGPKKKVTFQLKNGGVNGTTISSRDLTLGRGLVYGEEGFDTLSTSGLVETTAITTSVTSASTDSQVPSAKAVYDAIQEGGGGGSSYTAGTGIDITNNVISVTGKVDTSTYNTYTAATDTALASKADTATTYTKTEVDTALSGYVTTDTEQIISGRKIFTYSSSNNKAIEFKQTSDSAKVGFRVRTSAATNNELASFEFRPNTFTIDNVQHPLMYFGHYRNTNTANAGVPQTVIGFRQYDQKNGAAYHYLMPLPEKAKTPFSLTTSFKDYYAPMGFKNGSTMITADDTGVVDLSSELGGLKLKKLTQAEYDALATKDNSTLYVIVN